MVDNNRRTGTSTSLEPSNSHGEAIAQYSGSEARGERSSSLARDEKCRIVGGDAGDTPIAPTGIVERPTVRRRVEVGAM